MAARQLAAAVELPEIVARILIQRGIASVEEVHRFLHPSLDQLHPPMQMLGMAAAVERLERAIAGREPILIYGDYDVDGTMATVVLKTAIELLGGVCDFHVPHRLREGYGMRGDVIGRAAANGVKLIISVDTGIREFSAVRAAADADVDLIVTDHHLVAEGEGVPKALAVLNPNQPDCEYPCKSLCGAGVAFKLAQALLERAGRGRLVPSFLKIVALATIADSVPLVGENRVIVALGLAGLHNVVNSGLKALLEVCELNDPNYVFGTNEVAFRIAPRINAAGRMDIAGDVVELFMTKDDARAKELAGKLNELNQARQLEEHRISEAAMLRVTEDATLREAACLVLEGEGWHRGVIGICASRLVERFGKPAVVIALEDGVAHGSGRSIQGLHLLAGLEGVRELFTRFGGHAHAVGFAMPAENVSALRQHLCRYASENLQAAITEGLGPVVEFDGELSLEQVMPRMWEQLRLLRPFGMGNPEPVFLARAASMIGEPRVMREKHLKLKLRRDSGSGMARGLTALGWRMAHRLQHEPLAGGDRVDLLFRIEENTHRDFGGGLQLVLADFRRAEAAGKAAPAVTSAVAGS